MKFVTSFFALISLATAASAANYTVLFDRKNIYNCVAVSSSTQVLQLQNQGWLTSVTGKCVPKPTGFRMCGMGGSKMINPLNSNETLIASDSCQVEELQFMGWIEST